MKKGILNFITFAMFFGVQFTVAQQPNIIVFIVDDMGWLDTSVPFWEQTTDFNLRYNTPNMETLAQEGMKFTQAYAHSVCTPSRISLLTGMNPARHRVTNWTHTKDRQSVGDGQKLQQPDWNVNGVNTVEGVNKTVVATLLPQLLKDLGYYTVHCGKAHYGPKDSPGANPLNLGFSINIAGHHAGQPGSYLGAESFSKGSAYHDVPGLEEYHEQDIFLTEALTLKAIESIDVAVTAKQPFFLQMAHYAVHTPIQADDRFVQKYIDQGLNLTESKYASMIEGMDKSLGDIMNYLKNKNIDNNTIILFISDNGGLSAYGRGGKKHTHNKPLSSGKGSSHEGGIREPMIVKWPTKIQANTISNEYVQIEDFFPSILEMAGITDYNTIQTIDGVSFLPYLLNNTNTLASYNRPLFWHYPNRWGPNGPGIGSASTVRLGDWKLIYYHASRNFELFNLKNDIGETNNKYYDNSEKALELATILTNYLKVVNAQMPIDKETGKLVEYPSEMLNFEEPYLNKSERKH